MTMGLFSSHVLKQTDPSVEVLLFFLRKKNFIRKVTHLKNTVGEKNILSLMS